MQPDLWHVQVPGSGVTQMTTEELRSALGEGRLSINTHVAPPGDPRWLPIADADLGESVTQARLPRTTSQRRQQAPTFSVRKAQFDLTSTTAPSEAQAPSSSWLGYFSILLLFVGVGAVTAAIVHRRHLAAGVSAESEMLSPVLPVPAMTVPAVAAETPPPVAPQASAPAAAPTQTVAAMPKKKHHKHSRPHRKE